MEVALAILASPAGQALVAAGISQVLAIAGGTPPDEAAAVFAQSTQAYLASNDRWEAAKAANPPSA